MTAVYLDTSALVKLVVPEAETVPLREWLTERADAVPVSSQLGRVELVRAVRRSAPWREDAARLLLERVATLPVDPIAWERAMTLEPAALRTLDAVHLACAIGLGNDLGALVAYDQRLLDAARVREVPVASPGAA